MPVRTWGSVERQEAGIQGKRLFSQPPSRCPDRPSCLRHWPQPSGPGGLSACEGVGPAGQSSLRGRHTAASETCELLEAAARGSSVQCPVLIPSRVTRHGAITPASALALDWRLLQHIGCTWVALLRCMDPLVREEARGPPRVTGGTWTTSCDRRHVDHLMVTGSAWTTLCDRRRVDHLM